MAAMKRRFHGVIKFTNFRFKQHNFDEVCFNDICERNERNRCNDCRENALRSKG